MPYAELFAWWAVSISFGIAFLIAVSIYLYMKRKVGGSQKKSMGRLAREFFFVWVLLGLLVLYIVSISMGSALLFAAGNIFFEAVLIIYLVRNRREKQARQ